MPRATIPDHPEGPGAWLWLCAVVCALALLGCMRHQEQDVLPPRASNVEVPGADDLETEEGRGVVLEAASSSRLDAATKSPLGIDLDGDKPDLDAPASRDAASRSATGTDLAFLRSDGSLTYTYWKPVNGATAAIARGTHPDRAACEALTGAMTADAIPDLGTGQALCVLTGEGRIVRVRFLASEDGHRARISILELP